MGIGSGSFPYTPSEVLRGERFVAARGPARAAFLRAVRVARPAGVSLDLEDVAVPVQRRSAAHSADRELALVLPHADQVAADVASEGVARSGLGGGDLGVQVEAHRPTPPADAR